MKKPAVLLLEDGTEFRGWSFGADGEAVGEVVFNTAMAGYPEILTDPSYRGQMVCMTYPLIGNYGITEEDFESRDIFLSGFIVKENSRITSNYRSTESLSDLLIRKNIVAIEKIDTRKLVRHIRDAGAMKGILSTVDFDKPSLTGKLDSAPGLIGRDLVEEVTIDKKYTWNEPLPEIPAPDKKYNVVAVDFGIKYNILRSLVSTGCGVTVVPAYTSAGEILAMNPDGIFLSNGPGDPSALTPVINEIKKLLDKKPIFGICLGHQILCRAMGGSTYKLKFGHHGGNHPVKNLEKNTVEITVQNHGFAVDIDSITDHSIRETHLNLNDGTNEGIEHLDLPIFSVQYHPEAGPGPHDSRYLFDQFIKLMEDNSSNDHSSPKVYAEA
jgi:carbamoyl-phosphate synthase small subunit